MAHGSKELYYYGDRVWGVVYININFPNPIPRKCFVAKIFKCSQSTFNWYSKFLLLFRTNDV